MDESSSPFDHVAILTSKSLPYLLEITTHALSNVLVGGASILGDQYKNDEKGVI